MKHRNDPPAPLFESSGPGGPDKQPPRPVGFNYRDMAAQVRPEIVPQLPPKLDAAQARRERDAAIQRVVEGAELDWLSKAQDAIRHCAANKPDFTVDDVQEHLARQGTPPPSEGRVMGAAMSWGKRTGLIEPTGQYRPSSQPQCHANPRMVWRPKGGVGA